MEKVLEIINIIRENRGNKNIESINKDTRLREDIGFDSLDLAEFTVHIEVEYGIDIFEKGLVSTIGEVLEKLN